MCKTMSSFTDAVSASAPCAVVRAELKAIERLDSQEAECVQSDLVICRVHIGMVL